MSPAYGVLSDDFTGGMLVAGYFETSGIPCPVFFDPDAMVAAAPDTPVVILASRTRLIPAPEAEAEMRRGFDALDALGCGAVAYKACATFDSTEQGNIGNAADLLADRYGQTPMLISAGFPDFGLTVHQGHMIQRGVLISDSIKRFDPVTPMPDPNLVRFLSHQTRTPLGLVSHLDMARGEAAARAALEARLAEGHRHVMLDASDPADIEMSVTLARGARAIVASDPLIVAFGLDLAAPPATPVAPPRHAGGPAALFVGSVGPVAEGQLAAFAAAHPVLTLDLLDETPEAEQIARAIDWATPRIGDRAFGVTTWADDPTVRQVQGALGVLGAARKAERLLAGIAAGVHARGVRRILVGGGETSGAIVQALGIPRVRPLPLGPLGGGLCVAEGDDPVSFFLKSGKLGTQDVFLRALTEMQP